MEASVSDGVMGAGADSELGIALDSQGNRMCYVGACVSKGEREKEIERETEKEREKI